MKILLCDFAICVVLLTVYLLLSKLKVFRSNYVLIGLPAHVF